MAADARDVHLPQVPEVSLAAATKICAELMPLSSPREVKSAHAAHARRGPTPPEAPRLERAGSRDLEDKCGSSSSPSKDSQDRPTFSAGPRLPSSFVTVAKRLRTGIAIGTWFFFNISMGTLVKWTYLYGKVCNSLGECRSYEFPFFVTAIHMLFSWLVCLGLVWGGVTTAPYFSLRDQAKTIAPLALCFSAAVGLGNLSLTYIYPSFNQMLSSLSPLVTVFMSVLMRGKRYNAWTWGSMPLICGGLLVCSSKEVNYNLKGVICVVLATILRAVKSVMQESLLDQKLDSITLLFYLAPWAGGFLLLLSLLCDGLEPYRMLLPEDPMQATLSSLWAESPHSLLVEGQDPKTDRGSARVAALLVLSGINACFLNLCGNQVTAYCGAVMLQILGNVKACLAIGISAFILGNTVTPHQVAGVVVSLFGVWVYQKKGGPVIVKVASSPNLSSSSSQDGTDHTSGGSAKGPLPR